MNKKWTSCMWGSLRKEFLFLVAVTYIVSSCVTLAVFYGSVRAISLHYVARYATAQNRLEKNGILAVVDKELTLSRKLADDPQIVAWMKDAGDPALQGQAERQLESYRRFLDSSMYFIALEANRGYYIAGLDAPDVTLSQDNPTDRWYFEFMERGESYALNVNYDALIDEVRVWMNVMVRDEAGLPLGVAGAGMNLGSFLDALVSHRDAGIQSIIVDGDGVLQAHRDRSLIEANARVASDADKTTVFDLIGHAVYEEAVREAIARANGESPAELLNVVIGGAPAVLALDAVPELGWYTLVFVDAGTVIAPGVFRWPGLAFLASLMLVLGCIVFALNRLVLRPLEQLTAAADIVARGAYDVELPAAGDNEIGRLSASFNVMTEQVRAHVTNRETALVEVGDELRQTNASLQETLEALRHNQERYRTMEENMVDRVWQTDMNLVFTYFSPTRKPDTCLTPEEVVGRHLSEFLSPERVRELEELFRREVEKGQAHDKVRIEEEILTKTGTREFIEVTARLIYDDEGHPVGIQGLNRDITERKEVEKQLRLLATTDPLTHLPNRRHFLERLCEELHRLKRYGQPAALLMMDLDHFKKINDTYGHGAGDETLRVLAGVIHDALRKTDFCGRLGGEEFAIVLPETNMEGALPFAERLRLRIAETQVALPQDTVTVTVSIGVALLSKDDATVDDVLARADQALYKAKEDGRNRVVVQSDCPH